MGISLSVVGDFIALAEGRSAILQLEIHQLTVGYLHVECRTKFHILLRQSIVEVFRPLATCVGIRESMKSGDSSVSRRAEIHSTFHGRLYEVNGDVGTEAGLRAVTPLIGRCSIASAVFLDW